MTRRSSPPRADWPPPRRPELAWLVTMAAFALAAIILRLPSSSSPLRFALWLLVLLVSIGAGLLLWLAVYALRALRVVYVRARWYSRLADDLALAETDLERERAHSAALAERLIAYLAQNYPSFEIRGALISNDRLILIIEGSGRSPLQPGDTLALVDTADASWFGQCIVEEVSGTTFRAAVFAPQDALWFGYVRQQAERHAAVNTTVVAIRMP